MRSGVFDIEEGDYISVVHLFACPLSEASNVNADDSIWIGIHED